MTLSISYDENLIAQLSSKFDLREPNIEALRAIVQRLESGDFDPEEQLVLDLATGVGKTYIMAAFVEYLRSQGVMNVMVVTPNTVVQQKTVADFASGSERYIGGFDVAPSLVTPTDVHELRIHGAHIDIDFSDRKPSTVYIFNVQQLFPPKDGNKSQATGLEAQRRKTWRFQEETGVLAERLIALDNLVVIVDEAHLFGSTAKRFQQSLKAFKPAATVGLTASSAKDADVVYRYPLWKAIFKGYVKQPVLVYRESGYESEERQLQDAVSLLRLKEEAYLTYRNNNPGCKQTTPLLFVVCSDVNHATETAALLRNTYYSDSLSAHAVLQVDNQHNDETTQSLLRYLDTPSSPVKVIVSVNKLREGWDTKRIAVMCTLRTMGSEVLTQQVMGRGLRLPFGEITGVPTIDELDIISHKSFVTLLESENVLREFGIEEEFPEVAKPDEMLPEPGSKRGSHNPPDNGQGASGHDGPASDFERENNGGAMPTSGRSVGARGLTDEQDIREAADEYDPVIVSINECFAGTTFLFPSSKMVETQRPFSLLDIDNATVVEAAKLVTDADEHLNRTKIGVDGGGKNLRPEDKERVTVPSFHQSEPAVRKELIKRVMGTRLFEASSENDAALRRNIVPLFMRNSGIQDWTEKAKQSAVNQLVAMVKRESKKAERSNTVFDVVVTPIRLPIEVSYVLGPGKDVKPLLRVTKRSTKKDTGYEDLQYYGPWEKGLYESASFQSFSAEYQLAHLLNYDPDVKWWTRIYDGSGARIAYTTRYNYVPDFVVLDKDGKYWIIEAKRESERDDETVLKKRKATEYVLRKTVTRPEYKDQWWAYMISFENDIRNADSFADLIAMCDVESSLPM